MAARLAFGLVGTLLLPVALLRGDVGWWQVAFVPAAVGVIVETLSQLRPDDPSERKAFAMRVGADAGWLLAAGVCAGVLIGYAAMLVPLLVTPAVDAAVRAVLRRRASDAPK